ncbi:MAG TPA: cytochrome c peroxidase [Vicinamibacterales bacterium]|nr:cytochrome c peroxidase [Vicinamibacterales bacterium]
MLSGCGAPRPEQVVRLEADNPRRPIGRPPLGIDINLRSLPVPPTPERVRLGRWLFFDRRLSRDGTISCATCHQPAHAFSQTTPVATGVGGAAGTRKVPTIINLAIPNRWSSFKDAPVGAYFWDGRARTLEAQALVPIAGASEMGNPHPEMVSTLSRVQGYGPYFAQAFGDARVTRERVARAIADYERTRMSGNSAFDRWQRGQGTVSDSVRRGFDLFTGTAGCAACHTPPLFTDGTFHNLGIGWNPDTRSFTDEGRYAVTKDSVFEGDPGSFKTPTLREVSRHAPYMHDGSIPTLRDVVEFYNRGGIANPDLDDRLRRRGRLGLTPGDANDLVSFLVSLEGTGWQDNGPSLFPQ